MADTTNDPQIDIKPRSRDVTDGVERAAARGMLRAVGMGDDDWVKPQIGVASSWNEITPCNLSLDRLAKASKEGVHTGGGFPLEFGTISVSGINIHSGAGRITTLRMRPLTLVERLDLDPTVSLRSMIDRPVDRVEGRSDLRLADYVAEIAAGGFPGLRHLRGRALRNQLDGNIELIINRELPDAGLLVRRPQTALGWLRAYAAATATTTTWEKIRRAATPGDTPPALTTTRPYLDLLSNLRILDPLPAWLPTNNHLRSLTNGPKHHLADPALALRLLDLTPEALLDGTQPDTPIVRDGTFLGAVFESLVALSLRVFAQHAEADVYHLRTKGGRHEIDFVIEHGNRIVAVETKLAATVSDHDVRHLHWLRERLADRPTTLLVITTGAEAYTRADGIHVVPLALLGP